MNTIELFGAIIASSAFTTFISWLLNYKKNKLENEKVEVDIDEKLISRYKIQLSELLIEVQTLRSESQSLREEVAELKKMLEDDCIKKDCHKRITKKQVA